jgi:hypothetical protein
LAIGFFYFGLCAIVQELGRPDFIRKEIMFAIIGTFFCVMLIEQAMWEIKVRQQPDADDNSENQAVDTNSAPGSAPPE